MRAYRFQFGVVVFITVCAALGSHAGESPSTSPSTNPSTSLSTPSPPGAALYFITPTNGATVTPTFTVRFGLKGMGIAPAGMQFDASGHHHLLIDQDTMPDKSLPLPTTDHILHFGKGQTETELTLAPGEHTLQLVLGNHLHVLHTPPVVSEKIRITVKTP